VSTSIPAIILAAGASRRLGQPKQLVRYKGETLLERAIRMAGESGAAPVIVVLGANREQISPLVKLDCAKAIFNPHWEWGIAASIHAGLEAAERLSPELQGVLILPCDQVCLSADHLRVLISTFAERGGPSIVASTYADVLGIPAVFPHAAFSELMALEGDKGARALLLNPPCAVIEVPFAGGEIDVDEPTDLDLL
jgi:CTP:molybdopterin cytidylyltransferase MocA